MAGRKPIPLNVAQIQKLAARGLTEGEIARQLGISQDTLTRRKQNAEFADAIKAGQDSAHSTVSNSLFKQAAAGNVTAIIWYEKTRRGMVDTQRNEHTGKDGNPIEQQMTIKVIYADPDTDAT